MRPQVAYVYAEHEGRHRVVEVEQDVAGYRLVGPPRDDYEACRKAADHLNRSLGVTKHRAKAILNSALAAQTARDRAEHGL